MGCSGIHQQLHHHDQDYPDEDSLDPDVSDPVGIFGAKV
jgi:hypothetical protein